MADIRSLSTLQSDLHRLGVREGDGLFVHASMKAVGPTIGGARTVVEALLQAVGPEGLVGMPGASSDAYFPPYLNKSSLSEDEIAQIEKAVPGYDKRVSPATGMGVIAETFRNWPGTQRSDHPTESICLNGNRADELVDDHPLAWATGPETPLGRMCRRPPAKVLLIGVGWNRCSALHIAETLAETKRTKVNRFKGGAGDPSWIEVPDVADDLGRLFPRVGAAFEQTGAVAIGRFGEAQVKMCALAGLVAFATDWIDAANKASGDRH